MSLPKPHPPPPRWLETYLLIREMRARLVAAVDTMGCDRPQDRTLDPKSRRLTILVSLMLSSQTKDETTSAAVTALAGKMGGVITLQGMLDASDESVQEAICKVGFWRRKTQYLRQTMEKLRDEFDGDVPKTVDELCSLPGVGPKMAFLCLQNAWDINVGIGVDTHVHRITNRLGWHKPPTTTPEQTRLNLQSWLPREYHAEINHMLVGFGQALCFPVAPRCDLCALAEKKLCPSRSKVGNVEGRKEVVWKKEEGEVKLEVEEIGELGGRREVFVNVPGEGSAEVDVKVEEGEEEVDEIVQEVEKAVEGKEVNGRVKEALEW
ncbi:DNA glycosylase [Dacryopinax primogenitus]|uniref:Endonuclease III homolog n=1 Tax=Dacryopinax primogenitus (strain DJM 731) TaxID=1858805 RepID=M5GGP4_DACPD|nr:DNA glycosylase [Dacryopinax primogenitus]EJU05843.1 DNA glycosylase [Dacryopinax primogenitus]